MAKLIHGDARMGAVTRLHNIWRGMLKRCDAREGYVFSKYAARGIAVCPEWRDYPTFKAWAIANGYADNLSIERRENDGGYEPGNCRWITMGEQARNRRSSRLLTAFGRTQIAADWCREFQMDPSLLAYRLKKGLTVAEALALPVRRQVKTIKDRPCTYEDLPSPP